MIRLLSDPGFQRKICSCGGGTVAVWNEDYSAMVT
jgi:hypothetical protein